MLVVDASVLVTALGDDGADGDVARRRLRDATLVAPEIVDLEVSSVLRRLLRLERLTRRRAELALSDLIDLPLQRVSHRPLLPRCWTLRHTMTVYDASYVALAEELEATFVTADASLSRAPGLRCDVEILGRSSDGFEHP